MHLMVTLLVLLRMGFQWLLEALNAAEVRRHAGSVPPQLAGVVNEAGHRRTAEYSLAKIRLGCIEHAWAAVVLAAALFSGILPLGHGWITGMAGGGAWGGALFLFAAGVVLSLPDLPLDWWAQFRLEGRFGFNRSTLRLWAGDKLKGLALSAVLGIPLLAALLALVDVLGRWWWLWGFALVFCFQLALIVIYPRFILPWFNKLTPMPDGELRGRLLGLCRRLEFPAAGLFVIDGSKRSAHSNAFFTGFGRFRRIVLYDTLLQQLAPAEIEAVLAHEIGHYKLGHVPRMLAWAACAGLAAFAVIAALVAEPRFAAAFGFPAGCGPAPAFLLFALMSGLVTFWLAPVGHLLSRRHEYQADAYARSAMGGPEPLVAALRKLSATNLSNLTPHPLYSGFYYSHPTLIEREHALAGAVEAKPEGLKS